MDQERLFRLAVEVVHVACYFEPGRGWRLEIGARHQGEGWVDADRQSYTCLSTDELVDTIDGALAVVLGL